MTQNHDFEPIHLAFVSTGFQPHHLLSGNDKSTVSIISPSVDRLSGQNQDMAHRRGNTQKDMFYIGAYLGYVADNKLRSLSGKTPATNVGNNYKMTIQRTCAQNNGKANGNGGSGYDLFAWYQLIFIQCMYVLKYKNLNSKSIIGQGVIGGSLTNTGGTNTRGMNYGTSSAVQIKLFGIEDLWGNLWDFIAGMTYSERVAISTATDNFNDAGTDYTSRGSWNVTGNEGYVTKVAGTTHGGFLSIHNNNGSETTYYCVYLWQYTSANKVILGGSCVEGSNRGGIFEMWRHDRENHWNIYDIGVHMMYL